MPVFIKREPPKPLTFIEALKILFRIPDSRPQPPAGATLLPWIFERSYPAKTDAGFACNFSLAGYVSWAAKTPRDTDIWATKEEVDAAVDSYRREIFEQALKVSHFGFGFANVQIPGYTHPNLWIFRTRRHHVHRRGIQDLNGVGTVDFANRLARRWGWSHSGLKISLRLLKRAFSEDDIEANYAALTPEQLKRVAALDPSNPSLHPLDAGAIQYLRRNQRINDYVSKAIALKQEAKHRPRQRRKVTEQHERLTIETTVTQNNQQKP